MHKLTTEYVLAGIDDFTKNILVEGLQTVLDGIPLHDLTPPLELIFNAFKLCSLKDVRLVILGQDPYIKPGEAMGLSFSVPIGVKIPPSLKNIFKCLVKQKLIAAVPSHGDLSSWAAQGVLLLNTALTTTLKKSNAHKHIWSTYISQLLYKISTRPNVIFMLFGNQAAEMDRIVGKSLKWGHPSPMNSHNRTDNPANFINCTVFAEVNKQLTPPINWTTEEFPVEYLEEPSNNVSPGTPIEGDMGIILIEPTHGLPEPIDAEPEDTSPETTDTLWIFTDGGVKNNGKLGCIASWGFYITDNMVCTKARGLLPDNTLNSNNRGELMAMFNALNYVQEYNTRFSYTKIMVVSDSEYSIYSVNVWVDKWILFNNVEKKNLDIILPTRRLLDVIHSKTPVAFKHIRSHTPAPINTETDEWFRWRGNNIADILCGEALGRKK